MASGKKQSAILFIFITLLIDITGWGIIIPVMPQLIRELSHGDLSDASRIGGWISFAYAVTQFFFAPILGNLSDKFGRRPVILFSLLGFALDYIIIAQAPTLAWLFIGRIIAGVTGASITTASAFIADISNNENRAKNFGMIGAAFGLGFIIGPVVGGLLGQFGSRVPFYAAAVLCLINFIYGYFILPESLDPSTVDHLIGSEQIPSAHLRSSSGIHCYWDWYRRYSWPMWLHMRYRATGVSLLCTNLVGMREWWAFHLVQWDCSWAWCRVYWYAGQAALWAMCAVFILV